VRLAALPVDDFVPAVTAAVREHRAAVITAAPGAGKTTRVPPALASDGAVIVLQPRRVAARAIARRIASERGWTLGREVGWHVRFERRFGPETRVLLATEGILTARLQQDPLLSDFTTIVLDEFHERTVHADLGIALARQAWRARSDLRIVVMSATLDTEAVSAFLDGCPVIAVPGRTFPLTVTYRPDQDVASAAADLLEATPGNVLCFLPGAPEIRRAEPGVRAAVGGTAETVVLFGSLASDDQERALAPAAGRRVILATNIAETSLTVPGVTAVIDSGLVKVARYDPDRAVDSLQTERVADDAASQRAGRAGRVAAGRVVRLWNESDRLRPRTEPEMHAVDLSDTVLQVIGWGGDPNRFEWFEAPAAERVAHATGLLERLGAVRGGRLTDVGARMLRLPLHPRLARMLIEAEGARPVALACAALSERVRIAPGRAAVETTTSDLLSLVQDERQLPPHVVDVGRRLAFGGGTLDERDCRRAIFSGYVDRVAVRREPRSSRFILASGHGAVLGPESGVYDASFIVAVDVQAGRRGEGSEARIRLASAIEPDWLQSTRVTVDHEFNPATGSVGAVERRWYDAVVISERSVAADPEETARLLASGYLARQPSGQDEQLLRRLRFAGRARERGDLARAAAAGHASIDEVSLADALTYDERRDLEQLAPATLGVPSGRRVALHYEEDGSVAAAVKLQELFGLAESPRIGARREPVTFRLLAPNGRPVQTTRDLRSFWNTTYHDVRRELRGRYPKHPWPDDPWSATPTARTRRAR
jgi:ATP-dependent helicase HrpB